MTLKSINTASILLGNLPDDDEFIWETLSGRSWVRKGGVDPATGKTILWQHRVDGPAVIWPDGHTTWWVDGNKMLSYSDFQEKTGCTDADILLYKLKYGDMDQ